MKSSLVPKMNLHNLTYTTGAPLSRAVVNTPDVGCGEMGGYIFASQ